MAGFEEKARSLVRTRRRVVTAALWLLIAVFCVFRACDHDSFIKHIAPKRDLLEVRNDRVLTEEEAGKAVGQETRPNGSQLLIIPFRDSADQKSETSESRLSGVKRAVAGLGHEGKPSQGFPKILRSRAFLKSGKKYNDAPLPAPGKKSDKTLHAEETVPRRLASPPPIAEPPAHLAKCSTLPPFQPARHLAYFQEFVDSNWARKGASPTLRSVTEYLSYLYPYVACVPAVLPSVVTRPNQVRYSCSGEYWAGPRETPLKLVSFVPIGYEMDILDIRLHEHEDVVDLLVLSESVYTHRVQRKPLFYERSKEHYERFRGNILHIIDDEAALFSQREIVAKTHDDWRNDGRKLGYPWQKFLEAMGLQGPNDPRLADYLFVASDMDELPSAEQLAHFKFCRPAAQAKHYLLGARFFQNNFRWWRNGGPVGGPNSLEYSSTVTYGSSAVGAKAVPYRPGSKTGKVSFYSEHPGWVLNRFFGPYVDMFKELALAEGGNIPQSRNKTLASDPTLAETWRSKGIRTCCPQDTKVIRQAPGSHMPPWYAELNKKRFPFMFPSTS